MRNRLFLISLFFLLVSVNGLAQKSTIDSLKVIILSSPDDSLKVKNLISLSQQLAGTDPQNAVYYGVRAKDLAKDLDYQAGLASALKYLGNIYYFQGKYLETIRYWEQASVVFGEMGDKSGVANILSNLGGLNAYEGDDNRALELLLRSRIIAEEIGDTLRIATVYQNIAMVYAKNPVTIDKAGNFYLDALAMLEELNDEIATATVEVNLGEIFYLKNEYDTALYYLNKALETFKGNVDESYAMNYIGKVYAKRGEYDMALKNQQEALILARNLDAKTDVVKSLLSIAETYSMQGKNDLAIRYFNEANTVAQEIGLKEEIRDIFQGLALSYADVADYRNAFKYQERLTAIKDTLFYSANQKKLDVINANFENEKKQGEIDLLTIDRELQNLNLQKEKIIKNTFLGGFIVLLIIAFIIYRNYRNKSKTNKLLDKQNEEIEGLLLNILPAEVANELQHEGYATPQNYESATVLFTDFKGFTQISSGLLPHELIAELNSYFNEFDDIIGKHNLEKIKTIGDAYMCAGGIPSANTTHAIDAVEAGLAIQQYIARKNEKRKADGQVPWELRVGIHTGPVVAGVVGRKKYAYDIWGDAVNIASRMESNGEAYKVNISQATYKLVKDKFKCVARGKIGVKGAGEKKMYFVEGLIEAEPVSSEIHTIVSKDLTVN
jgi:class 3 adenylate cyclase